MAPGPEMVTSFCRVGLLPARSILYLEVVLLLNDCFVRLGCFFLCKSAGTQPPIATADEIAYFVRVKGDQARNSRRLAA